MRTEYRTHDCLAIHNFNPPSGTPTEGKVIIIIIVVVVVVVVVVVIIIIIIMCYPLLYISCNIDHY